MCVGHYLWRQTLDCGVCACGFLEMDTNMGKVSFSHGGLIVLVTSELVFFSGSHGGQPLRQLVWEKKIGRNVM